MKLTFLGTRGYIEPGSRRHRMHSSLLVSCLGERVMVNEMTPDIDAMNEGVP